VRATDPQARETARERLEEQDLLSAVDIFAHPYEATEGADALVIATEWNEYKSPDLERLATHLRLKRVFDGRNVLVPAAVSEAGLHYRGVGRPPLPARS
jgi:UDPglucose 6-dehydrogenase